MTDKKLRIKCEEYRNIFFVQNMAFWNTCPFEYDKKRDLVLTFDFSIVNHINSSGGEAKYIDHVVCSQLLEVYNYKMYDFFQNWHYDSKRKDIFSFMGIEVGSAFRIEIFNDITYYVRIFVNLHEILKRIKYKKIFSGISDRFFLKIFRILNIETVTWSDLKQKNTEYYFPVFQWMDENIYPSGFRYNVKIFILKFFDKITQFSEKMRKTGEYIYIHRYHPTKDIIYELQKTHKSKIILEDFNSMKDIFFLSHLPIIASENSGQYNQIASKMLDTFRKKKNINFYIDEIDISNELCELIIRRISNSISRYLKIVDLINDFFLNKKLQLMVTIASIGSINRLMINYCKMKKIPIFMIINGFLGSSFCDEAKDGDWINAYGESIKKNYFTGMNNIVCLGDPRMDNYARNRTKKRTSKIPTICIGAAGFSNVDLNSYVAFEFDFLNDIMKAFRFLIKSGKKMNIIIKVRPNGYIHQYRSFLNAYYSDMPAKLLDKISMEEIFSNVDFYISFYSQTLFEASSLGIPVLYYKKDTQLLQPPFDGKSELVTAFNADDLIKKIEAFYNNDKIYDSFKNFEVMEKYIGPLDGKNLERNVNFIRNIINPTV